MGPRQINDCWLLRHGGIVPLQKKKPRSTRSAQRKDFSVVLALSGLLLQRAAELRAIGAGAAEGNSGLLDTIDFNAIHASGSTTRRYVNT